MLVNIARRTRIGGRGRGPEEKLSDHFLIRYLDGSSNHRRRVVRRAAPSPLSVISFHRSLFSPQGIAYRRPTRRRSVVFLACETVLERWNAANNGLATDAVGA